MRTGCPISPIRIAGTVSAVLILMFAAVGDSGAPALADKPGFVQLPSGPHTSAFGPEVGVVFDDGFEPAFFVTGGGGHGQAPSRIAPVWTNTPNVITMSSPRLGDVDGNGVKEIVLATMGAVGNPYSGGRVFVLDVNGQPLPGWPLTLNSPITSGVPVVADIDHNGDMEIIAESWAYVHVWNHDGTDFAGWPKYHGTGYSTSAAVADLDGDGDLEIICPTGTKMYAWHHDGTVVAGWPFTAPKPLAAPAVADIDGDGAPEIIAGTWEGPWPGSPPYPLYMWKADGSLVPGFPLGGLGQTRGPVSLADLDRNGTMEIVARIDDYIYVWDKQGNVQPGWPITPDAIRNSATAVGDLDGDGDLEIVIAGWNAQAFHHDGTAVSGWPVTIPPGTGNVVSGPVIADIDGSPSMLEVVVHSANTFCALHADGTVVSGFPYTLSDDGQSATFAPAPAVGDCEGDGKVEYVFVSVSGRIAFFAEPNMYSECYADWPVFQHDARNTCYLPTARTGDLDCDGALNAFDIDPFVLALTNPAGYIAAYPNCDRVRADCNCDGAVNAFDIDPFVECLTQGCP
jgi:hypothetical protein